MLSVYKASAGSGKTFTLTREYIKLLFECSEKDARAHARILAVTFTKKATAEMKNRILFELYRLATNPETSPYLKDFETQLRKTQTQLQSLAQSRLYNLLQDYSHFSVSTIDGFFQQIVRNFARELGLNASYAITLDSDEVVQRAVDDLLFALQREDDDESSDSAQWLTDFAMENIREGSRWNPRGDIEKVANELLSENLQSRLTGVRSLLLDKDFLRAYKEKLKSILDKGTSEWYRRQEKSLSDEVLRRKRDYYTAQVILKNLNALGILVDVSAQIELTNREESRMPISDVNLLLHRVIDGAESPFIYEKIGNRIHHYMIDEFQDTSKLQWENFRPLVVESNSNGQKNLIVGDTKQSIYRWRNSDWRLLEHVSEEISPSELPNMSANYRSSAVVVDTNNDIFQLYADWAAAAVDTKCKMDESYGSAIRYAYTTLHQDAKCTDLQGYYYLKFFECEKNELQTYALDAMLPILSDIQARGKKLGDVAVLVRNGKEAQCVSRFLLENGYSVQSAEGLCIASHPAVELLVCLLQQSITPEDDMLRTRVRMAYANHLFDDQQKIIEAATSNDELFTEDELSCIARANTLPLYEQVQCLVDGLQLTTWEQATPYVTAFLDVVYDFVQNKVADTGAFLNYWERKQNKLSIPSSTTENAIQVMTIFKSKGLEFDMVFVPFLTWSVGPSRQDASKILWCEPKTEPFDSLPLLPVTNSSDLGSTHFAKEYAVETRDCYMDNLNLTYVAFTRPKTELYAFGCVAHKTAKGEDSIGCVGELLSVLLRDRLDDDLAFARGLIPAAEIPKQKEQSAEVRPSSYCAVDLGKRLRLRTHTRSEEDLTLQDIGTRMHDLLSAIIGWEDVDAAIRDFVEAGKIPRDKEELIRHQLDEFRALLAHYDHEDWFSGKYRVLCEQDILSPTGNTYRPDRIMICDNEAVIVDYKFGQHRRPQYMDQVRLYSSLLSNMGYTVRAYLVYVSLNEIDEV